MAEITYKFDTIEDKSHLAMINQAPGMWATLYDLEMALDGIVKQGDQDDERQPGARWVRSLLSIYLGRNGVDLEEVE